MPQETAKQGWDDDVNIGLRCQNMCFLNIKSALRKKIQLFEMMFKFYILSCVTGK
jgi:hypothetical protein